MNRRMLNLRRKLTGPIEDEFIACMPVSEIVAVLEALKTQYLGAASAPDDPSCLSFEAGKPTSDRIPEFRRDRRPPYVQGFYEHVPTREVTVEEFRSCGVFVPKEEEEFDLDDYIEE